MMSNNSPDPAPRTAHLVGAGFLCGAFFMVILDAAIVIVALPAMQSDLGFSEQGLQGW